MVDAAMPCHSREATLTALAPAKINLTLQVHGKRQDGYHALTSLVIGIELFDELSFAPSDHPGIHLTCDDPTLPTDGSNLVTRAAALLAQRVHEPSGVSIELHKRIPVAAGLGGGNGHRGQQQQG